MACPWFGLWKPNYAVYVFVGRPGMGKTTAVMSGAQTIMGCSPT